MAQSAPTFMGARALGMGNASACLSDAWALHHNVAGLTGVEQLTAGSSVHVIPSFRYFNRMAAVIAAPMKPGVAGIGLFRFGDELYNEQILSAGFANRFGLASLGLKANYIQFRAEGMETRSALTLSFGGIASLTQKLLFGAHIININQPVVNALNGERISTQLIAGISLLASDRLTVSTEVGKDAEHAPMLKAGIDYQVFKKIAFRTGFQRHPEAGFLGLGFETRKFQLDYALQFFGILGMSHQASVTCQLASP